MEKAYDGRQVVGMDLHRRRSVLVRTTGHAGVSIHVPPTNSAAHGELLCPRGIDPIPPHCSMSYSAEINL